MTDQGSQRRWRRALHRGVMWVAGLLFAAGIILPLVWELLGRGGPAANGSNFDALGLPDWVGYCFVAVGVIWWAAILIWPDADSDTDA